MYSPPSVSCQTIPSNVTEVPGSQGPRQSGSVMVPTLVPTHTSALSCNKNIKKINTMILSKKLCKKSICIYNMYVHTNMYLL